MHKRLPAHPSFDGQIVLKKEKRKKLADGSSLPPDFSSNFSKALELFACKENAFSPAMCIYSQLYYLVIIIGHLCQLVELKLGCPLDKAHSCCWYLVDWILPVTSTLVCEKQPNLGDEQSCDGQEFRRCCRMDQVCYIFESSTFLEVFVIPDVMKNDIERDTLEISGKSSS